MTTPTPGPYRVEINFFGPAGEATITRIIDTHAPAAPAATAIDRAIERRIKLIRKIRKHTRELEGRRAAIKGAE